MKKPFVLAAIAAMLFSCAEISAPTPDPEPTPTPTPTPEPEKWTINIATNITRATDTEFEYGDKVGLYVVNDPEELRSEGNHVDNVGFTNYGGWHSDYPVYWKDKTTNASFYCYYPYTDYIPNVHAHEFWLRADQRDVYEYKANDFLWGKVTDVEPTQESVGITVNHIMSSLVINLNAGNGYSDEDMENAWVTIHGLKTAAYINLESGAVEAAGDPGEIIPMAEGRQRRALVIPQNVYDQELIKVSIGDKVYNIYQTVYFESGKQYTCTLTIDRVNQGINIGIGGWESGGEDFGGVVE